MDYIIAFIILGLAIVGFSYIIANILSWLRNRTFRKEQEKIQREKALAQRIARNVYDEFLLLQFKPRNEMLKEIKEITNETLNSVNILLDKQKEEKDDEVVLGA
jgi:predicted PurR-regulated permease PerM